MPVIDCPYRHGSQPLKARIGLSVEPFRVNHFDDYSDGPSLGYRVEYNDRSVVLSGDTRYCTNLIEHARNADLLIHEVAAAPQDADLSDRTRYVLTIHTQPEECGRVFSRARPRLAVYNHVIQLQGATLEEIIERTRKHYDGLVMLGEDLMKIEIGDSVKVLDP